MAFPMATVPGLPTRRPLCRGQCGHCGPLRASARPRHTLRANGTADVPRVCVCVCVSAVQDMGDEMKKHEKMIASSNAKVDSNTAKQRGTMDGMNKILGKKKGTF